MGFTGCDGFSEGECVIMGVGGEGGEWEGAQIGWEQGSVFFFFFDSPKRRLNPRLMSPKRDTGFKPTIMVV